MSQEEHHPRQSGSSSVRLSPCSKQTSWSLGTSVSILNDGSIVTTPAGKFELKKKLILHSGIILLTIIGFPKLVLIELKPQPHSLSVIWVTLLQCMPVGDKETLICRLE